jgi:hypothetical protein
VKEIPRRNVMSTKHTGLDALLTPEESVLLLIDHQPFQFANLHSHEPMMVINNVSLAKTAKVFGVPTILTTVVEERGGYVLQGSRRCSPTRSRSTGPSSTLGKTAASSMPSLPPDVRSFSSPAYGQRSVW